MPTAVNADLQGGRELRALGTKLSQRIRKDSSSSEEREAKRLCKFSTEAVSAVCPRRNEQKFFASFFQKRSPFRKYTLMALRPP
jgi:hypothetical protein